MKKYIETLAIFNEQNLNGEYKPQDLEPLTFELGEIISFNRVSLTGFTTITLRGADSYYVAIDYDKFVKLIRANNELISCVSDIAIKQYENKL